MEQHNKDPLRWKFTKLDRGNKQHLDQDDIQWAFTTADIMYPKLGARILIKLFSSNNTLNFDQFVQLNYFVLQQVYKFKQYQQNGIISEHVLRQILNEIGFDLQPNTVDSLFMVTKIIFDQHTDGLSLLEFQFLQSFLHLASQLFNEWNQSGDNILHIGPEKMLCLIMWFM